MKYKNRALIIVINTLILTNLSAENQVTFDWKNIHVKPEDVVKIVTTTAKAVNHIVENKRKKIEIEIKQLEKEKVILGKQHDQSLIGTSEFQTSCSVIDKKIDRLMQQIKDQEESGKNTGKNVQQIVMSGWNTLLEDHKEQQQRKTKIAVAAASQALANEGKIDVAKVEIAGAMEKLKFVSDPKQLKNLGLFITLATLGITSSYYGAKLFHTYIDALIDQKPRLVKTTSRIGRWEAFMNTMYELLGYAQPEQTFDDIIFSSELKDAILHLAAATKTTQEKGLPYRNVLFYGPPGTGKTLCAQTLALASGMDWAIMSGADFKPMLQNGTAIYELQKLIDWAERSTQGLLIFIDEADSFLVDRTDPNTPQAAIDLLNKFLAMTGTSSNKYMFVFATNHKHKLDAAAMNRIQKMLEVPLPGINERKQLIELYLKKYISDDRRKIIKDGKRVDAQLIVSSDITDTFIQEIAEKTDGLSGRQIEQIIDSSRTECYLTDNLVLTKKILNREVSSMINQHITSIKT